MIICLYRNHFGSNTENFTKNNFTCSSWSILIHSRDIWSSFVICLRNILWSSYLVKVLTTGQLFSVLLLKTLIVSFAIKSPTHLLGKSISLLIFYDGIFEKAGLWILFVKTLSTGYKEFIKRILFTLKLLLELVDTYNK